LHSDNILSYTDQSNSAKNTTSNTRDSGLKTYLISDYCQTCYPQIVANKYTKRNNTVINITKCLADAKL